MPQSSDSATWAGGGWTVAQRRALRQPWQQVARPGEAADDWGERLGRAVGARVARAKQTVESAAGKFRNVVALECARARGIALRDGSVPSVPPFRPLRFSPAIAL